MAEKIIGVLPYIIQVAFVFAFLLLIVQVVMVVKKIKESMVEEDVDEATLASRTVMNAIREGKIKKHILSDNTKKEYDSRKTLENYREFLKTNMFQKIMNL